MSTPTGQEALDADVAAINAAITAIVAEIDALKAAAPNLDFTGLDAAVASLQAVPTVTA